MMRDSRPNRNANDLQSRRAASMMRDERDFLVEALNETAIVAVTDVKGKILYVNDKLCEISGYSREELIGQDHRILKSGVHSTENFRSMYRVIASGRTWRGEFCNRTKNGDLYWVNTTIIPRVGKGGKVTGYTSIRIDITQSKLMDDALRRSELLNRSTMMALGDGVVVHDAHGNITSFNPAAERILGLSLEPHTGRRCVNPDWSAFDENGLELTVHQHPSIVALATGQPQQHILLRFSKPGEPDSWISMNSVPMRGPAGSVDSVITSMTDVTERLRTKQMLDEAIAAIPEGFTIFDENDRLIAFNEAYPQTYPVMAPAIKPGASFSEILTYGVENGQFPDAGETAEDHAAWLAERRAQHTNPSSENVLRLTDGRWIQIRERRTPSGYFVGCRMDITHVKNETLRLKTVVDNFPGAISLFDAGLNLIACNDAFRTLLDLPSGPFYQGLPNLESICRLAAERGQCGEGNIDEQVAKCLELASQSKPYILHHTRPTGLVLEIQGIPIPGGGFISTLVDITERHAAAQRLAESERVARQQSETLGVTLAHMSQGLSMFDENDRLLVWNDRFRAIYRMPADLLEVGVPSQVLSEHLSNVGFVETSERRWRELIRSGCTFDARITSRDGSVIKVVYTPVQGSGWVATHEDITDRIVSQNQIARQSELLKRSYFQLDAALSSMSQGLILLNADGEIVLTNGRFREMYQFGLDDVTPGRHVGEIIARFARDYTNSDFSIDAFMDALSIKANQVVHLNDGRIIQINRASTPDGGWVATHEDITERELASQQIAHLAFHDPLTGLANRAEFYRRGEEALRSNDSISVILVDLDRFKTVNDTLGHSAGDALLKKAASRMRAIARPADIVARIGGDEFAILQGWSEDQREAAASLANQLIDIVAQPYLLGDKPTKIGASIGVAVRTPDIDSMESLIHRADLALYEVKSLGRNACVVYNDELGIKAAERLALESELRSAIFEGHLELHYQPIVSMIDRRICGFEALVRWRHPQKGLLSPDRFITVAEESDLIVDLGEFVVRQACADASSWPSHVRVAVNISPTHLLRKSLLDTVIDTLQRTNIDAARLEIEVTETVLMKSDDEILSDLHRLQSLGVRVALDDFGTGFSSLSHLRMFAFDKIKIDRSFVSEMGDRRDSAAIVCAMTGLARALDMQTTAEGIETEDQFQILRAAGCSQGQGYLFGRPLPASDTLALLGNESPRFVGGRR